ncbi:MAG: hypothetical protein HYZ58_15415 [Acidobacteria bacterium]|nr:hypothetical protein [Acidobacteriota bacterium]
MYSRLAIALRQDVADHPQVKGGVLQTAMRSLQHGAGLRHLFARSFREAISTLWRQPERCCGNGAFSYRCSFTDDDPRVSAWLLVFYGHVHVVAITAPRRARGRSHGVATAEPVEGRSVVHNGLILSKQVIVTAA